MTQKFDNIKANEYLTGKYKTIMYEYSNGRKEAILVVECKNTIVTAVLSTKDKVEFKKLEPSFIQLIKTLKVVGSTSKQE